MHEISHPTYHPSKQQYFASIYFAAQGYDRYLWSYSCDIYVGFGISGLLLVWTIRQFQVHRRILWDDCDQSRWMIFPGTLSWRNCLGTIVKKNSSTSSLPFDIPSESVRPRGKFLWRHPRNENTSSIRSSKLVELVPNAIKPGCREWKPVSIEHRLAKGEDKSQSKAPRKVKEPHGYILFQLQLPKLLFCIAYRLTINWNSCRTPFCVSEQYGRDGLGTFCCPLMYCIWKQEWRWSWVPFGSSN